MSLRAAPLALVTLGALAGPAPAAPTPAPQPPAPAARKPPIPDGAKVVESYIKVAGPRVVLTHVKVIDGTGRAALDDRNVTLDHGKITAIDAGADVAASPGTTVIDLRGRTV